MKKQANHHLCQIRLSGADISVELDGLHLSRVTTRPPTPEEKTRGITERASIQIEYTAYRTYNQKTGQWSQTCDQPNWYFPATIIIDKSTDGQWRVNPANFHQLNRISDLGASSTIHMKS